MKQSNEIKKECFGNFCKLKNPDCEKCRIDEALDELEMRDSVHISTGRNNNKGGNHGRHKNNIPHS